MKKLLITTTDNLDGYVITKYYNTITSNVVVGTNILSDFTASLTDFFGGRSSTYEKKIQLLHKSAIDKLAKEAELIGANAVLGLKIDIDEISGKGSQMFMITAYGTPVMTAENNQKSTTINDDIYDGQYIENKVLTQRILSIKPDAPNRFRKAYLDIMLDTKFTDFIPYALDGIKYYTDANTRFNITPEEADKMIEIFKTYFNIIDRDISSNALHNTLTTTNSNEYFNIIINTIIENGFIDYAFIKTFLSSQDNDEAKFGLRLANANKSYYTNQDISLINEINELIKVRFQPVGKIGMKKKLLSSSEVEIWNCECGKVNDKEAIFCLGCGNNIYGFKENELKPSEVNRTLEQRLTVISSLQAT